jgi:hypothetical protein
VSLVLGSVLASAVLLANIRGLVGRYIPADHDDVGVLAPI